jgi:hypothetical protein
MNFDFICICQKNKINHVLNLIVDNAVLMQIFFFIAEPMAEYDSECCWCVNFSRKGMGVVIPQMKKD